MAQLLLNHQFCEDHAEAGKGKITQDLDVGAVQELCSAKESAEG